mgnify:CR=1 FL=1
MPKLVKGGKYVFGWVAVGENGEISIPPEAADEYGLTEPRDLIAIEGSQAGGGFGVSRLDKLADSPLGVILERYAELESGSGEEPVLVEGRSKIYARVSLNGEGRLLFTPEILEAFGIRPGDKILALRGSNLALSYAVRGPIVEEAARHPELKVFP